MDQAEQVGYWVRLAALVLIVVLQVIVVLVQVRRKRFVEWRRWMGAAVPLVLAAVTMALTGVRVGIVWIAGLMVVGAALGWLLGSRAKVSREEEHVLVVRSWVGPVAMGVSMVLMAITLLFGTTYLFAWTFVLFAAAAALVTGSAVGEIGAARGWVKGRTGAEASGAGALD